MVVHDIKVAGVRLKKFKISEETFERSLSEVVPMMDQAPEKPPDDFLSNVRYAQELKEKMKIN